MSRTVDVGTPPAPAQDERVAQEVDAGPALGSPRDRGAGRRNRHLHHLLHRRAPVRDPSSLATVLYVSSTYGIPAVAVALLMIGEEFDLSAGVAVTASALVAAMLSYQFSANMWVGVVVALVAALVIYFINGFLVVKTGIPSFLVTLGTFFMLRGLNLAVTKIVTGNVATNGLCPTSPASSWDARCSPPRSASAAWGSGSPCSGGSCSSPSPPGSCSAPTSATGSSPSAPRPAPGQSASRSTRSRSACS